MSMNCPEVGGPTPLACVHGDRALPSPPGAAIAATPKRGAHRRRAMAPMARAALPLTLLACALLAGCSGGTSPTSPTGPVAHQAGPYALDCGLTSWNETCLARARPTDSPS